jgi:DNA-directed RNA polymerase specialized sigma24 family protein
VPLDAVANDTGGIGTRSAPSAETEALAALGTERVRALLDGLSPDQRDVLLLRLLGDLTVEQAAGVLGKRPGAVKALQRRGLAAVSRALAAQGVTL